MINSKVSKPFKSGSYVELTFSDDKKLFIYCGDSSFHPIGDESRVYPTVQLGEFNRLVTELDSYFTRNSALTGLTFITIDNVKHHVAFNMIRLVSIHN